MKKQMISDKEFLDYDFKNSRPLSPSCTGWPGEECDEVKMIKNLGTLRSICKIRKEVNDMSKWNHVTINLTDAELKEVKSLRKKGITTVSIFKTGLADVKARQPKKLFKE